MRTAFIQDWIASSSFWVFAAVGVVAARKPATPAKRRDLPVQAIDLVAAAAVLVIVRVLTRGITLAP